MKLLKNISWSICIEIMYSVHIEKPRQGGKLATEVKSVKQVVAYINDVLFSGIGVATMHTVYSMLTRPETTKAPFKEYVTIVRV